MLATICSTIRHISVITHPTINTIQYRPCQLLWSDGLVPNLLASFILTSKTHTHLATEWYGAACSPQTCYNFLWHCHVFHPDFDEAAPFILLNMDVGCPKPTHQDWHHKGLLKQIADSSKQTNTYNKHHNLQPACVHSLDYYQSCAAIASPLIFKWP